MDNLCFRYGSLFLCQKLETTFICDVIFIPYSASKRPTPASN